MIALLPSSTKAAASMTWSAELALQSSIILNRTIIFIRTFYTVRPAAAITGTATSPRTFIWLRFLFSFLQPLWSPLAASVTGLILQSLSLNMLSCIFVPCFVCRPHPSPSIRTLSRVSFSLCWFPPCTLSLSKYSNPVPLHLP